MGWDVSTKAVEMDVSGVERMVDAVVVVRTGEGEQRQLGLDVQVHDFAVAVMRLFVLDSLVTLSTGADSSITASSRDASITSVIVSVLLDVQMEFTSCL
jgi:hypothetical protein